MSKQKVKALKLKMPLWQELVYLVFVAIAPIVITCIELFNSHSTIFKWTFASIGSILITFIVIKKFILKKRIDEITEKRILLEHDYSVQVGDPLKIKAQWKKYQLFLYLYSSITVLLTLCLGLVFITALVDGLIAFKGAFTLILISVFVGMVFKCCTYIQGEYIENGDEKQ